MAHVDESSALGLPEQNFLVALHASFAEIGGVELDLPDRTEMPRPAEVEPSPISQEPSTGDRFEGRSGSFASDGSGIGR